MNELMIVFKDGNWIYFKTSKNTIYEARREFRTVCENAGIIIDNVHDKELVLRDPEGRDIAKYTVKV